MNAMTTGTTGVTHASTATTGRGVAGLGSEDFMKVLIAQLRYQDPFEPMGNEELLRQVATVRELEMNTQLTGRLEQLTDQQRFGTAATMIGKFVRGATSDGEGNQFEVEGIVTSIRFTKSGEAMLELDTGQTMPLFALTEVSDAPGQDAKDEKEEEKEKK
jgi:flagellar basal-body rod modification protein FlgD